MAFKFVAFLACVAVACAGVIQSGSVAYSAPAALVRSESAESSVYPAAAAYEGYSAPSAYAQSVYHAAPAAYEGYSAPAAYAQPAYHAAPAAVIKAQPVLSKAVDEYDPHPQYRFGYDVQDSLSGDSKSQVESRDGDVVQGEYSLIDADGYKRTVQYTADPEHGFNAVVHREPIAVKTVVKAAPVAYAAAPVVKASYAAPFASYGH